MAEELSRRYILRKFAFLSVGRRGYDVLVMIDRADVGLVRKGKWHLTTQTGGAVAPRARIDGRWVMLRHLVAEKHYGARPSPDHVCEHLNGDLLDCRADNISWTVKGQTVWAQKQRELRTA